VSVVSGGARRGLTSWWWPRRWTRAGSPASACLARATRAPQAGSAGGSRWQGGGGRGPPPSPSRGSSGAAASMLQRT
jgi:hypothetical protein